jgi:hypothetical protein
MARWPGRFFVWSLTSNAVTSSAVLGTLGSDWQLI